MSSIKTISDKYEKLCGKKLYKFFLRYALAFAILIFSMIKIGKSEMLSYSITTVIVTLTFQFFEIGKANYRALNINQNNLEESFSNFKAVYTITYVTMALFVVVYCILSEILLSKFTACSVDIIKILFDIECGFLLFGIIPLIFIAPTYKTSFLILIVLNVIFVAKDFLNFQATVLMLVIYAILIPLVTFSSVKLMLTSIKQRIGQGFGLYDKLDKSYRIYTGKPLSFLIKMYCLMNVLLFLIRLLLSNDDNFTTITNSYQTAVIVASMGIFGAIRCEPSELFHRKSCYFLSIKNRLSLYKDYYFITYLGCIINLLIFIVLTYFAGGLCHILPEKFYLNLIADVISLLMLFAIAPFMFTSKNTGILMAKNMLLAVMFIPLNIFMVRFHWSLEIVFGISALILMVYSNKRWLKRITGLYLEA